MGKKLVCPLPVSYTAMQDVSRPKGVVFFVPSPADVNSHPYPACRSIPGMIEEEHTWLDNLIKNINEQDDMTCNEWISWAAYLLQS